MIRRIFTRSFLFFQVAIETIYVCIQTIIYALLLFSMIGFEWKLAKVLYFYYFIFMCFTYFSMYGMMVVALTPNHQIAAICMSFFLSFWNLFSGFLVPRPVCIYWNTCFSLLHAFHFLFVLFAYSRSKHSLIIMTCYKKFAAYPCVVEVVLLVLSRRLDNLWYFHLSSWRQGYSTSFRRWDKHNSQDIP